MISKPSIPSEIFRAYDIRGKVGSQLNSAVMTLLGQALATMAAAAGVTSIVVGRDGRKSSPAYASALIASLSQAGMTVLNIGLVPTPVGYWTAAKYSGGSVAMITGSHNPKDYNGVKIMLAGTTLAGAQIQRLRHLAETGKMVPAAKSGAITEIQPAKEYLAALAAVCPQLPRSIKIVVDCGNGAAGPYAPRALDQIGCDVLPLFANVDGNFPNHHPDPSVPANMTAAANLMQETGAELGIAFDGDGDRLGLILPQLGLVHPDQILMLLAVRHLATHPGDKIVFDVKCSRHVAPLVTKHGGQPIMCRTGHSFVKQLMEETGAKLGGEMSGHFFFHHQLWAFDDALLAAIKLLSLVAEVQTAEDLFSTLPNAAATPEIKVAVPHPHSPHKLIEQLINNPSLPDHPKLILIDGLRADWRDGFGLVRASNTTAHLILRFEGDTGAALERIQDIYRDLLTGLNANLDISF